MATSETEETEPLASVNHPFHFSHQSLSYLFTDKRSFPKLLMNVSKAVRVFADCTRRGFVRFTEPDTEDLQWQESMKPVKQVAGYQV